MICQALGILSGCHGPLGLGVGALGSAVQAGSLHGLDQSAHGLAVQWRGCEGSEGSPRNLEALVAEEQASNPGVLLSSSYHPFSFLALPAAQGTPKPFPRSLLPLLKTACQGLGADSVI